MIYTLIVGAISGWLAGVIFKGRGFGILMNVVIGVIGGLIGGWLFRIIGFWSYGFLAKIISSVVGAGILFWLSGYIRNREK